MWMWNGGGGALLIGSYSLLDAHSSLTSATIITIINVYKGTRRTAVLDTFLFLAALL